VPGCRAPDVDFTVSLPPEACAERIRQLHRKELEDDYFLWVKVKADRFRVLVSHGFMANSFRPALHGTIKLCGRGTQLAGRFRLCTWVRYVLYYWITFCGFLLALLFTDLIRNPSSLTWEVLGVSLPLLLFSVFGPGLAYVGWRVARGQKAQIESALREAFKDVLISSTSGEPPFGE